MTIYPKTIFLIRHAEEDGDKNNPHLSMEGYERAAALVTLFGPGGRLAPVQYLIAADRSKHSNRSVETLETLANWLHLKVGHEFDDDEYKALAKRLLTGKKYADATILVCWHHSSLPALAKALGVNYASMPSRTWPDDVFDQVWIIDFDRFGPVIRSEPQGLDL